MKKIFIPVLTLMMMVLFTPLNAEAREPKPIEDSKLMEIVTTYAPELVQDFTEAYKEHVNLHEAIEIKRFAYIEHVKSEAKAVTLAHKEDLMAQVENGDMTLAEARSQLKAFTVTLREQHKADRLSFTDALKNWHTDHGNTKEEIATTKDLLMAAIENNDTQAISELLIQTYEYIQVHLAFDTFKLELIPQYQDTL